MQFTTNRLKRLQACIIQKCTILKYSIKGKPIVKHLKSSNLPLSNTFVKAAMPTFTRSGLNESEIFNKGPKTSKNGNNPSYMAACIPEAK